MFDHCLSSSSFVEEIIDKFLSLFSDGRVSDIHIREEAKWMGPAGELVHQQWDLQRKCSLVDPGIVGAACFCMLILYICKNAWVIKVVDHYVQVATNN